MPAYYGSIFPEFKQYCGTPLRLLKAMYGMTLSGKFWYQDLLEFLVSMGQSFVVYFIRNIPMDQLFLS
jgi:hypothetical protein